MKLYGAKEIEIEPIIESLPAGSITEKVNKVALTEEVKDDKKE